MTSRLVLPLGRHTSLGPSNTERVLCSTKLLALVQAGSLCLPQLLPYFCEMLRLAFLQPCDQPLCCIDSAVLRWCVPGYVGCSVMLGHAFWGQLYMVRPAGMPPGP